MKEQQISINITGEPATYRVQVGTNILSGVGEIVRELVPNDRAAVVVDERILDSHGATVIASLEEAGFALTICEMEGSEEAKSLETVRGFYAKFLTDGLERRSPVIAVGGGVVGDTAGFAAATYLRGVPFVNVPTTLLAMVDASVGGKTGVNIDLPGAGSGIGKNLVGAFHQPQAVIIDVNTLETLAERHCRSGMAECIKHAVLADGEMFNHLAVQGGLITEWPVDDAIKFIARNVAIKADVVKRDVHEANVRMTLNLGHTFAHVIEPIHELDLFHGEAVGLGMVAAAKAGVLIKKTDADLLRQIEAVLVGYELPTRCANLPSSEKLVSAMLTDKKVAGGRIRLVIPVELGRVEIVDDVSTQAMTAAWEYLRADGVQ